MWNDTTIAYYQRQRAAQPRRARQGDGRLRRQPEGRGRRRRAQRRAGEVGKIRTTCVATLLRGGHAENALPQSATATVNCRIFPGTAVDDVKATLAKVAGRR
jgi:acetylornithine deacetylase/succinyl-diaminopimelate desuccinylase-like protein